MEPALGAMSAAANQAVAELTTVANNLSERQLTWSPAPGMWSIAQCLDHVAISCAHASAELGRVIGAAPRRAPALPYRPGIIGRRFIAAEHDLDRRRTSPRALRPTDPPAPDPLARTVRALAHLSALAVAADGLDVNRVRVSHAFIRMSIGDALSLAIAHATRHVAQIRRVRDHPAFPT